MRSLILVVFSLLIGAIDLGAASPVRAGDLVKVGFPSIYPPYVLPYAAKDLGYYKDNNLEVEIINFRGGPAVQEAIAAGAVDITSSGPASVQLAMAKGVQEKIVALSAPTTPTGWYIMVPKDSPVKTMKDLENKTIGVTQQGSLTDMETLQAAKRADVNARTIPVGYQGLLPALKNKQVDASMLFPLNSYKAIVSGDYRIIDDLSENMEPSVAEGWVVTTAMIKQRPDVLRRWLQATSKALVYMQSHRDWSIMMLKKYHDEPDDRVAAMAYDTLIMKCHPDGVMKPEWQATSLKLAVGAGFKTLKPEEVFTAEFTPIKLQ